MNGGRPGLTGFGSLLGPAFLFTICPKNGIGLIDRRDVTLAVFEGCFDQRSQQRERIELGEWKGSIEGGGPRRQYFPLDELSAANIVPSELLTLKSWQNGMARLSLLRPAASRDERSLASSMVLLASSQASRTSCTLLFCHSGKSLAT
jgi:hypothetical protein